MTSEGSPYESARQQNSSNLARNSSPNKDEFNDWTLYVRNIPGHVSEEELSDFMLNRMSLMGVQVDGLSNPRVRIRPGRGDASVEFAHPEHARLILNGLLEKDRWFEGNLLTFNEWRPKGGVNRSNDYYGPNSGGSINDDNSYEPGFVDENNHQKDSTAIFCNQQDVDKDQCFRNDEATAVGSEMDISEDQEPGYDAGNKTDIEINASVHLTNENDLPLDGGKVPTDGLDGTNTLLAKREKEITKLREELTKMKSDHALEVEALQAEIDTWNTKYEHASSRYNAITEALIDDKKMSNEEKRELRSELRELKDRRQALEQQLSIFESGIKVAIKEPSSPVNENEPKRVSVSNSDISTTMKADQQATGTTVRSNMLPTTTTHDSGSTSGSYKSRRRYEASWGRG